jgi:hypothetical protein
MGTIRFKRLARLPSSEIDPFLEDPVKFIGDRFGGGKFKVNLHHGLHFVNTRNARGRSDLEGPPGARGGVSHAELSPDAGWHLTDLGICDTC